TSSSERLLDTIFDITVLVKDNPPITNINIKVVNHILNSTKNAIVKKLIEIDKEPKIKKNNDPFLSTKKPTKKQKKHKIIYTRKNQTYFTNKYKTTKITKNNNTHGSKKNNTITYCRYIYMINSFHHIRHH